MCNPWISAFRLHTLPLAVAGIGMGGFLAAEVNQFDGLVFGLCMLTALLLQLLSNLANDYGDSVHGADNHGRKGPLRAVQSGLISTAAMKKAVIICAVAALLSGSLLLYCAVPLQQVGLFIGFFILGIFAVWAAVRYTAGKNPYGYIGFGDVFVLIFFGPVAVLGTFYLQTNFFDPKVLLPAVAVGCFSVAVLNVNNIRDIDSDKAAGKRTVPVRIGLRAAKIYHLLLLFIGFLVASVYVLVGLENILQLLSLITFPLFICLGTTVYTKKQPEELNKLLKQTAFTILLFVLTFGTGLLLFVRLYQL